MMDAFFMNFRDSPSSYKVWYFSELVNDKKCVITVQNKGNLKSHVQKSRGKMLASILWGKDGIIVLKCVNMV